MRPGQCGRGDGAGAVIVFLVISGWLAVSLVVGTVLFTFVDTIVDWIDSPYTLVEVCFRRVSAFRKLMGRIW